MSDSDKDKDHNKEEPPAKEEKKDISPNENKPSRLAERKGQRPAFPFKRKTL